MAEESMDKLWADLKTHRDELKLKIHLARAELRDEWETLEKKWPQLESKLKAFESEVGQSASELKESAEIIGEELGSAYERMKKRLEDPKGD